MSQHPDNQAHAAAFAAEVAHLRAARIAGQSGRLLDLFDYLATRGPFAEPATQGAIAAAVFGQAEVEADDASVRVYVHRLRKRLEDHYRDHPPAPGAPVIELPAGTYALRLAGDGLPASPAGPAPDAGATGLPRARLAPSLQALAAALLVLAAFAGGWWLAARDEAAPNALWQPLADGERPVLLVLGDYYLFGEIDPIAPDEGRLIRDFRVNSPEDLLRMQEAEPARYAAAEDVGLNYLPFQTSYALQHVAPLLAASGRQVEVIPASDLTARMLSTHDVIYVGLLSGMGLLEDITFAGSTLAIGDSYDEIIDRQANRLYVSDEARRLAAPVFYRDYAYLARYRAPGGALVTVVASERVTALRGIGPIVAASDLPDELDAAASGTGFEALYQFTGQQGADLSGRLILARGRE